MSAQVVSLQAYRERRLTLHVERRDGWVVLAQELRACFLTPRQALDVVEDLQEARTLAAGSWESHGVRVEKANGLLTLTTTATRAATLSRRAANSLTLELARAARAAMEEVRAR